MHDTASLILAIIGAVITWTASVISLVVWLTGKFRYLEKTIYVEMDKHRNEDDEQFEELRSRTMRLEIKAFGYSPVEIAPRREKE